MSKRVKSSRGVEWYETKGGTVNVFVRYTINGEPKLEKVGPVVRKSGRDLTAAKARKLLAKRRRERDAAREAGTQFRSPYLKRSQRARLKVGASVPDYLKERADLYSRPKEYRQGFDFILKAFGNRYADEITRLDIRQYRDDRIQAAGPFKGRRKIGPRNPEQEITAFSAYFEWLIEAGFPLDNPCRGYKPRTRIKSQRYRPQHQAIVPTDAEREAIFTANPEPPVYYKAKGRKAWADRWARNRAAWRLAYYLAGPRPESELCRLRWADVVFGDDDRARFQGHGSVTFRDTKTGVDRTVPLHPEAEGALRSIRPVEPDSAAYIFHKRNKPGEPWDRHGYKKAWQATLEAVSEAHPRLADMWVRDFRKAAVTDLRAAGTDRAIAGKLAGHSADMGDHYTQAADQHTSAAVMRLGSVPSPRPMRSEA